MSSSSSADKPRSIIFWSVIGLVLAVAFILGRRSGLAEVDKLLEQQLSSPNIVVQEEKIAVQVQGAVLYPGVYWFSPHQRVEDALTAAVLADNADVEQINQAEVLVDGQNIFVPAYLGPRPNSDGKYPLNQITAIQLHDIVGLSWDSAYYIEAYREAAAQPINFWDIQNMTYLDSAEQYAVLAYTYED